VLPIYVATAFAIVVLFEHLSTLAREPTGELPQRTPLKTVLAISVTVLPMIVFEAYAFSRRDGADAVDRRPLLIVYLIVAMVCVVTLSRTDASPTSLSKRPLLFTVGKITIAIAAAYSVVLCDIPFKLDFGHHKPYIFDGQAQMIDKAVLANKLFRPGKTHHLTWAGTYGYFVDGTMIDSLGKSDKTIARYPVDQNVSWDGMMGVPGHAKYDFRESILQRKPDIVVDRAAWGTQDVSPEMKDDYVLVKSQGVSLCVRKPLTEGIEALVSGSCPSSFFYTNIRR
jgi:hypothetical protein